MVGGSMLTISRSLPEKWVRPVVESVVLPAHAQTSAINGDFAGFAQKGQTTADATPILDLLAPRVYAGATISLSTLNYICVQVDNNSVTSVLVLVSNTFTLIPQNGALPQDIPGSVALDISSLTSAFDGASIEFDGPGSNGLAGSVVLTPHGGPPIGYAYDIGPGPCGVVLGP
jgi:hypothetical protein